MPQRSFLFWTSAGSLLWILALVNAGLLLGDNYRQILDWIAPFTSLWSRLLLVLIAVATIWLVARALQRSSRP